MTASAELRGGVRPREVLVDHWVHWASLCATPIAVAILIWLARHSDARVLAGLVVYSVGLLAMVVCSAVYHLADSSPRRSLLRRLDHAAIFLLIAGTYTPFTLDKMGRWGLALLVFVWVVAACGMSLKLFRPATLESASVVVYLLLGWSVLAVLDPLLTALSTRTLALLGAGGLFYTIGVGFHLWERLPYQNAIWHGFVLAGAACHYAAIVCELE